MLTWEPCLAYQEESADLHSGTFSQGSTIQRWLMIVYNCVWQYLVLSEKDQTQEGAVWVNLHKNPNQTKQLILVENT